MHKENRLIYNGVEWINYQGVLIPNVAPDIEINLTKDDIKYLLSITNAYFLRWISDWDSQEITEFWHIIKDKTSSLDELSKNTRHNIKRGLKRCTFNKVDAGVILEEGYDVYKKAFLKYDTFIKLFSEEEFKINILEKQKSQEWDFWEVRNDKGHMIAYSVNKLEDNMCAYKTTKFDPEFQKLYASEGLFYTMNSYYLNHKGVKYIDDGSRSLSHKTSIQEYFVNKFKFRKAYCKLHIEYSLKVELVVSFLFPFRKIIAKSNHMLAQKVLVLLKHEEIRRSFEK